VKHSHVAETAGRAHRAVLLAIGLALAGSGAAATTLDTLLVASGLSAPVYATSPLVGGPLFVVEKGGTIKAVLGGVTSTFLSLPVSTSGEQGLLGLAFDPNYGTVGSAGYRRFFVDYIDAATQDSVVASYRANSTGLLADAGSRVEVLRVDQPTGFTNHKAGWLGFKPGDANNLYIATGDGGSSNDPSNNAQNRNSLLGKMLRVDINRDDFADPNLNYGVPLDNPYFGQAGVRGEIFAYGLRNPWRNSFDRLSGDLWLGDVGQGALEEVDRIAGTSGGGQNFGWRVREGTIATPGVGGPLQPGMVDPLLVYDHSFGNAITGGYVVRDPTSPLYGRYIFADSGSGRVWVIAADGSVQTLAGAEELTALLDAGAGGPLGSIVSFGEGPGGEIYIVDIAGRVVQITSAVPEAASALLFLAGLTAVVGITRRQRVRDGAGRGRFG
jgi:glucose/arabinose dehydrogenase